MQMITQVLIAVAGFIINRLLMPMINEAFFALMEGVATAEDIDRAMKQGTNHPMGPLAVADLIGAVLRFLRNDSARPVRCVQPGSGTAAQHRKQGASERRFVSGCVARFKVQNETLKPALVPGTSSVLYDITLVPPCAFSLSIAGPTPGFNL